MSNDIIIRPSLTPDTWQMIAAIAPAMHTSRLFGVTSPEQAMAIMLKGYELGLGLTASFEFIQVVQGRPTLSPRGALALIHRSGELQEIKVVDEPDACSVCMKRRNGFSYDLRFTIKDAEKAGLIKKDSGWEKYPANMLRWRAIGFCADVVFPDVLGGMKHADEFDAPITNTGDVDFANYTEQSKVIDIQQPDPVIEKLNSLTSSFGAERVMAVSNGILPSTLEELAVIEEKLNEVQQ